MSETRRVSGDSNRDCRSILQYFNTPVLILFFVALAFTTASCGKSPDIPIIASGAEYMDRLKDAEKLSSDILARYETEGKIEEADKKKLREALVLFDGLVAFAPDNFGAYFGKGKIHEALGEPEKEFAAMQKFIELAPPRPIEEVKVLLAEAHYVVAKSFENRKEYELAKRNAERSVKYVRAPNYLSILASCLLRENKVQEAHTLVDEALRLDPENPRAKLLHTMLKHE